MKCDEAAEFLSALCDGERIPREAAEHIGTCSQCEARLHEYVAMGAELRRVASLEPEQDMKPLMWAEKQGKLSTLWQKGWGMMRIPRFAFAMLVGLVVVLGSGLVIVNVRAHSAGSVVLLKVADKGPQTNGAEGATFCVLSMQDKQHRECSAINSLNDKTIGYKIDLLAQDGGRIQLGIRTKTFDSPPTNNVSAYNNLSDVAQRLVWFEPGTPMDLEFAGAGSRVVTGEWMDHLPIMIDPSHDLDPGEGELRIVSPLLLQGKKVIGDMGGAITCHGGTGKSAMGIEIYYPGAGRYVLSLIPIKDAVQATVNINRIAFVEDGHSYTFVTGAPVARNESVWVYHDEDQNRGVFGAMRLSALGVTPDSSPDR